MIWLLAVLKFPQLKQQWVGYLFLLFSCSVVSDSLWHQATLSFTIPWSLLKLMSIESVVPSNHLILYLPLLLPSIFPNIRVFSNESALHIRCPKYCSFNLSISPSKGYSGLISFRIDWFDLLAISSVQFSSVAQSCSTLCDPMNCSTPGFPVFHNLLEFAQTHVHWVGGAI